MFVTMAIEPGSILKAVLREQDMQLKEAAILMDTDLGHLCRAVKEPPEAPLDLHKIKRLPWRVVAPFWSKFIAAFAENELQEMRAEKLQMARASMFTREERKSS